MADENKDQQQTKTGFPDVQKHNEEAARKLADQDAAGHSTATTPEDIADTSGALDKLADAATKKKAEKVDEDVEVVPDGKKKDDAAPVVVPDPDKKDDATPAPQPTAEELAKLEAAKKADEFFKDSPKLPPNASPKSSEAFSQIKIKAAQEISAREQALEALKKEKAELEERVKNVAPPEALKELEDLRQWRAKLDVEASPKFQEFDKRVSSNREFIYSQLKKSPSISEDIINQIKKYGGPDMVDMEKVLVAVNDPATRRIIEARLSDIEMEKFNKEKAIADTKENITKYLSEQQENYKKSATAHNEATKVQFQEYTAKLPWLKESPVDPKADDAAKKSTEEHNKFIKTVQGQLDSALTDDSPEMRAILLTGMAQLLYTQRVHEATKAELAKAKKDLAEVTESLDKVKRSSVSRLRESGASPNSGSSQVKKPADQFHTRAGDALDELAKQVSEKRAAAGL